MKLILDAIKKARLENTKLLAVLIDPDKFNCNAVEVFINQIKKTIVTHIFVGGSTVKEHITEKLVLELKRNTTLPILLFPGDVNQVTKFADAILYLSLLSGRNPDYLIEQQVQSVTLLEETNLEIIPTGYILVESGHETMVQKVTKTKTLKDADEISKTAKAGQYLGMQLIYLEAGSGAKYPVSQTIISTTKNRIQLPLIVGGGIRTKQALENAYIAGADLVVIGTAFEEDNSFYKQLLK